MRVITITLNNINAILNFILFLYQIAEEPKFLPVNVTILDAKEEINQSLTLKCKVSAFPKPQITWKDGFNNVLTSTVKSTLCNILYIEKKLFALKFDFIIFQLLLYVLCF